ncbi:hypothetical protein LOTGIDRAFT_228705 [Lottia gigantea]|uniref:Uncharacterized protein n=1 Tax=Lottia gigantea TaxID=225164 RepID=V4BQI6_LOTGI|nr:hypothetical protein LOTGIDRAFT_228705 [Lottia gigantea]ESO91154.1 hypothetical protein LOTGIDRAFT_228705 [Lottia gigantea]
MAKSLRSKRKRTNRRIKREKNAHKEIDRLKRLAAIREKALGLDTCTVKSGYQLRKDKEDTAMETDKPAKQYDPKTYKDEKGKYPSWMNSRTKKKLRREAKGKILPPMYRPT